MRILEARRPVRLGAEELIELGQAPVAAVSSSDIRVVSLSPEEGKLLVSVLEGIVSFANSFAVEFHSYCPPDRWQETLTQVGRWVHEVEAQVQAGAAQVRVPAEAVFRLVDLEKCVSAARDARLNAGKIALAFSVSGVAADVIFGWRWISLGLYLTGLAVLFGQPLMAKFSAEPREPFKPALAGACKEAAPEQKKTVLERVILSPGKLQGHHWGTARSASDPVQAAVCYAKGRYRVRIEGWKGDLVIPKTGWIRIPDEECRGDVEFATWDACGEPARTTPFGPVPKKSSMDETYWVEYTGPLTGGACRTAGPFG